MSDYEDNDDDTLSCDSPGSLVEFVVNDEEEEPAAEEEDEGEDAPLEFPYEQSVLAEHMRERPGPRRSLRSRKAPERYIDTIQDSIARLYLDDVPETERHIALQDAVDSSNEDGPLDNDSDYEADPNADEAEDDDDDDESDEPGGPENQRGEQQKRDGQQGADDAVLQSQDLKPSAAK